MKCPKCGRLWEVSNKITNSIYVCPYCGVSVDNQGQSKKNLGEIICKIEQKYGSEIIEDTVRLNALLMDFIPDMAKERKLVINALKEGVLAKIRKGIEDGKEDLETVARRCSAVLASELWITDFAAQYVINVIIQALGYETPWINSLTEEKKEDGEKGQLIKGSFTFGAVVGEEDLKSYSEIGYKAFASNKQLTEIFVPENIKRIYPKAFMNCIELRKVKLTCQTQSIGRGVFDGCVRLESISVADSLYYVATKGLLIDKNSKALIKCFETREKLISVLNGVKSIQKKAFERLDVESVRIPGSVEFIEEDAFYLTKKLNRIEVEGSNRKLRSIDGVLHSRDGKELLCYPQGKSELSYYLEDNVEKIGKKAFRYSGKLSSITFTNSLKEIGENAFERCLGIENIVLPRSVQVIGERAFQYCEKMMSVMLPQGIIRIGDCAFLGCTRLKTVSIPGSVKEIGNMAFFGCLNLTRVVIQENVQFIGSKAFSGCPGIEISVNGNEYVSAYCKMYEIKCTGSGA